MFLGHEWSVIKPECSSGPPEWQWGSMTSWLLPTCATSLQEWPVSKCSSPQGLRWVSATSLASFPSSVVHVWLVLPLHLCSGQDESASPELLYHLSDWMPGPSRWEADWLYARWRCPSQINGGQSSLSLADKEAQSHGYPSCFQSSEPEKSRARPCRAGKQDNMLLLLLLLHSWSSEGHPHRHHPVACGRHRFVGVETRRQASTILV